MGTLLSLSYGYMCKLGIFSTSTLLFLFFCKLFSSAAWLHSSGKRIKSKKT